jgi:hypothetical protein
MATVEVSDILATVATTVLATTPAADGSLAPTFTENEHVSVEGAPNDRGFDIYLRSGGEEQTTGHEGDTEEACRRFTFILVIAYVHTTGSARSISSVIGRDAVALMDRIPRALHPDGHVCVPGDYDVDVRTDKDVGGNIWTLSLPFQVEHLETVEP